MISHRSRSLSLYAPAFMVPFALVVAGCSKQEKAFFARKGGGVKFPVEVAPVTIHTGELVVHAVGSVEAFEIVQVTARVIGAVQKVRFKEGDLVKVGDPFVEIEPERYELSVRSAEVAYERAKASRREAQAGLERRLDIHGKNPSFVSPEDLDNWQTRALASQADSAQACANLELARLNLCDAFVPAPVSGAIQSRNVCTGQYVEAGALIATMLRRDPLLLRFAAPDQDAQRLHPG